MQKSIKNISIRRSIISRRNIYNRNTNKFTEEVTKESPLKVRKSQIMCEIKIPLQ